MGKVIYCKNVNGFFVFLGGKENIFGRKRICRKRQGRDKNDKRRSDGRKSGRWFHNTANGATASALVYSISETAKLNHFRPYYYFKYIFTELPNFCDEQGNIDSTKLDDLMPWSDKLLEECRKPRR